SVDGKPVRASNGALLAVEGDLGGVKDCASVFVLASFEPLASARSRPLTRWLQRAARSGVELGGIENGSLALAEAGLLDNHPAAIHWDNLAGFQELFPRIRVAQSRYSFSKNRVTCAGAAAILDMMVAWIGQHQDAGIASEVSRHLLVSGRSSEAGATHAGRRSSSNPDGLISRARGIMQTHVDDLLSCEAVAQQLDISLRQLERHFKQMRGHTVHGEYMLVR